MIKEGEKKTLVSGIKPTGIAHIGNYFGAMKQFVDLQNKDEYSPSIFVANYHAVTTLQEAEKLRGYTLDLVLDYLAVGLDPQKTNIFLQTAVAEVAELAWIFECVTTVPYLQRAHSYKDAIEKGNEINVGTFNYPMLMAADILIQDADVVPVGSDQKQHLEFARDTALKFNRIFGETFKLPEAYILEDVETVPGTDGRKMSKSYGNTIPLFAEDEDIKKIVMSIVTDSKTPEEPKDPNVCNVFALHKLVSADKLPELEKRYKEGGIGYKESKDILVDSLVAFITPLREKRKIISADRDAVLQVLKDGGEAARLKAKEKMIDVRKKVGLSL